MKILNMSVLDVAETFNLSESAKRIKEEKIDYDKFRAVGHIIDDEELTYLKNDVEVMAIALTQLFDEGFTKMTQGSNALSNYKEIMGKSEFEYYFPMLNVELFNELKKSYRGGFCYVNPINQNKIIDDMMVFDVNSLYPSVMYNELMPVGNPIFYDGKYVEDKYHPLYIQEIKCCFELKKNKIPTLLAKNSYSNKNEYIVSSNNEIETIVLTNVDLELFFEHYDVDEATLEFTKGYKFKGKLHLFDKYIEHWTKVKIQSKKDDNAGMYKWSKIMLNSLYGKFGLNPEVASKTPYLSEDGIVKYHIEEKEERKSIYVPLASFVTSYARRKTITTSQIIKDYSMEHFGKDYYVYSDTDSVHIKRIDLDVLKEIIEIDDYKLGAWKLETEPKFGKYIRQKSYVDFLDKPKDLKGKDPHYVVTCAGLSKSCIKYSKTKDKAYYKIFETDEWKEFSVDDFKIGFMCGGKLGFKHVKGGIVLVETSFLLKEKFM